MIRHRIFTIILTSLILVSLVPRVTALPAVSELRAISNTLQIYLKKGAVAGKKAALRELENQDVDNYTEATQLTLQYLNGLNISEEEIQDACSENPFTWSLSCLSFLIHTFAVEHNRNPTDFDYYIRSYKDNYSFLKQQNDPTINGLMKEIGSWELKVGNWELWVKANLMPQDNLEALFLGETSTDWLQDMDIQTITLANFLTSRGRFKNRPQFNPAKINSAELKSYLKKIMDDTERKLETERLKKIVKLKKIAIRSINSYGFTGEIGRKQPVTGTSTKATSKSITIKLGNGKFARRYWSDITKKQYIKILTYGFMALEDDSTTAVLILDWFGYHEQALIIAKKATKKNTREFYDKYLLGKQ